jgi:hypothetical protein
MRNEIMNHPAVQFGQWLKAKRCSSRVVARVFACRIGLTPAEYAEVESGILDWIGEKQERLIPLLLHLDENEEAEFNYKLQLARAEKLLSFADVYSEDELAPARCCTIDGKQIDEQTRTAIIKAVFTPLSRAR